MPSVRSPYKFLDSYTLADRHVFFGRRQETNILVADIVTARLVVLFARTGTGKTSLINAGARPLLHDRGYETFLIRVERDPIRSARRALTESHPEIGRSKPIAEQLVGLAKKLDRPIVLFFDQFEEFFLYVAQDDRNLAAQFVDALGDLYDDEDSGVHIVLSMREEFFVELELFRDRIPAIYHAESNLRLKRLDPEQAYTAITEPARAAGVVIQPAVVDAIIQDLSGADGRDALIEPAQLQIICHELWPRASTGVIDLDDYRRLGQEVGGGNVALAILYDRVRRQLESIDTREELELAAQLLPLLRSDRQTKWIRDVRGLTQLISANTAKAVSEDELRKLLGRMQSAGVLSVVARDRMEAVELAHDYLAEHLDDIVARIQTIWPRRMLERARARGARSGKNATREELSEMREELSAIVAMTDDPDFARAAGAAAALLFRSSVVIGEHGLALFKFAKIHGVEPIAVLEEVLDEGSQGDASRAVSLLIELIEKEVSVRAPGMDALRRLIHDPRHSGEAQRALSGLALGGNEAAPELAAAATEILEAFLARAITSGHVTPGALAILGERQSGASVALLREALNRPDLALFAQDALSKLVASEEVGAESGEVLLEFIRENLGHSPISPRAVRQLGHVYRPPVVETLMEARAFDDLRPEAEKALAALAESGSAVAPAAARVVGGPAVPRPRSTPETLAVSSPPGPVADWSTSEVHLITEYIRGGQCALFLGPGVHARPPQGASYVYPAEQTPPLGVQLSQILANRSRMSERFPSEDPNDLSRVALFFEASYSRRNLVETIRDAVEVGKRPSPLLRSLAELSFPLVVTTNYDRLFEQSLLEAGKEPRVVIYTPEAVPTARLDKPTSDRPLVLKLHGDIAEPDSLVVTDEDHLHFIERMTTSRDPQSPVPLAARFLLASSPTLFLGFSLLDYNNRLLFMTLRSKNDPASSPEQYVVDFHPDPLVFDIWQNQRRIVRFIAQDLWSFVPELYRLIAEKEMPP